MEDPLDSRRPELQILFSMILFPDWEYEPNVGLQQLQEDLRKQILFPDWEYEPNVMLMDEEFLKDFCKEPEQDRADSPEPSRVSMKSDGSMDNPPSFKQQHSKPEQDRADPPEPSRVSMKSDGYKDFLIDFKRPEQDRADSPEPSCVSMKSDRSMNNPLSFKQQHSKPEQDRADSPEPSCVSMKSDRSMNNPLSFKQQHSKPEQDRADSPEPSRVSMKSDGYKDFLIDFKRTEQDRADSPEPSCVSMKSDRSMNNPPSFKQQHSKDTSDVSTGRRSPLDSTFMFLEENIVGFVKKELKKFKDMLSPDYPECPEDQCEDEGVVDEDEAQRRYGSALVLKMTLLFMKRMNLGELADCLEKRSVRLLDSVAESKRHNGAFTGLMGLLFRTCFGSRNSSWLRTQSSAVQ
ncbi:uncharacterized protein [Pagrus major]|uniref:uncharacterized protein isoform X2 n=1 Tax=Pagrus major TaxID=143350 RepID=UPI003CC844F2